MPMNYIIHNHHPSDNPPQLSIEKPFQPFNFSFYKIHINKKEILLKEKKRLILKILSDRASPHYSSL